MRFKFSGYVIDICEDTFWAETINDFDGSITNEVVELYKSAIPKGEESLLVEGARFTFYANRGIIFSKEVWTKEQIEKAKFSGKEIFKFFNKEGL